MDFEAFFLGRSSVNCFFGGGEEEEEGGFPAGKQPLAGLQMAGGFGLPPRVGTPSAGGGGKVCNSHDIAYYPLISHTITYYRILSHTRIFPRIILHNVA